MKNTNSAKLILARTQIQYILIGQADQPEYNNFHKAVLRHLRSFPKDLLQLENAAEFYDFSFRFGRHSGINLYMLDCNLFNNTKELNRTFFYAYSDTFNNDLVKVFLIDGSINNHKEIAELVNEIEFGYYTILSDPGEENGLLYNQKKFFWDSDGLIKCVEADLPGINIILEEEYGVRIDQFDFEMNENVETLNPFYPTTYSHSNYFIINQILANDWLKKHQWPKQEEMTAFSKERVSIQLNQATVIDGLANVIRTEESAAAIEPIYAPMIIIAPFHFPKKKRLLTPFETKRQKMIFKVSQAEQKLNYTFSVQEDLATSLGPELVAKTLAILSERLNMIDSAGYLHAQLNYSPIFRMPVMGISFNMDLSHLERDFTSRKNAIKKIETIGKLMQEKMMAPELKDYLEGRNGQIVFISDLPMEWLRLNAYPICLTHDICRIPEFNFNSLLNNYIHNQRLTFQVRPDILKRTLIIHCASDEDADMQQYFRAISALQEKLGFKSIVCRSVSDIAGAVAEHEPDFLIFDCHGDFDDGDLSSYLVIDGKNDVRLTGEDIIEHHISAPLVFISACSTMPNYGYLKFLSDAFMQAGSFAVTATFLPIQMHDAAALIIKILVNLQQQETKLIFSNWLAFIAHTLRSTLIFETVRKVRIRNNLTNEIDDQKIADILLQLMVFDSREEALDELTSYLHSIVPGADTAFENLDHEWLSYTTVGRADLIYFEQWENKQRQLYQIT